MKTLFGIFALGIFVLGAGCTGRVMVKKPTLELDPKPVKAESTAGQDSLFSEQWNLQSLQVEEAWKNYSSSRTVKVALVGTGIDYNHEDLRANIPVAKKGEKLRVGRDLVDNDFLAFDAFGHDTYLAGVIGAVHNNSKGIKGILPSVSLTPVRYIDRNGLSTVPRLIKAIQYLAEIKPHVVLLNLVNLTTSKHEANRKVELAGVRMALKGLRDLKIPVVVGAGNSAELIGSGNKVRSVFFEFDNVIFVTSVDQNNERPWIANYSSQFVHTTAPGVDVLTTAPNNTYERVGGTSVAAAHVAAAMGYAQATQIGQKSYLEFRRALVSDLGSQVVPKLQPVVLGSNTLNLLKFLRAIN